MNWYGDKITMQEAKEATEALRQRDPNIKSQYFNVTRGQVLVSISDQAGHNAGDIFMSMKTTTNHALFVDPENRYLSYTGNIKHFQPVNEQQFNNFFDVKAVIEEEITPPEVEEIEQTSKEMEPNEPIEEYDEDIENNTD